VQFGCSGYFALVAPWNNVVHSSMHSFLHYLGCVQVNVLSPTISLSISLSYLLSIRSISASPVFSSYVRPWSGINLRATKLEQSGARLEVSRLYLVLPGMVGMRMGVGEGGWREIRQLTRSLIKDGLATLYVYIGITHTYVCVGYN